MMERNFVETKLFNSGNSKAVRISTRFAIAKSEKVFIHENEDGSLLITKDNPTTHTWSGFFQKLNRHQTELENFDITQDRSLNNREHPL